MVNKMLLAGQFKKEKEDKKMDDLSQDQEKILQEKIAREKKEAEKHNSMILPETPGYVRIDGPRRQYHLEILSDGTRHFTEI